MIEVTYIDDDRIVIVEANKIAINDKKVLIWSFSNIVLKINHDDIVGIIGASGKEYSLIDMLVNLKKKG